MSQDNSKKSNDINDVGSALKLMVKSIKEDCPVLSQEEESRFLNIIINSDDENEINDAVEKVALSNMRFVIYIANKYKNYGIPMEDLIQEGYLGLTRGIRKYNNLNVKLSTYVAWWIKQAITRYIINNSRNIRLPNHIVEKLTKIKKVINGWQLENSEMPSNKDIADELGIDEDEIEKLLSYGKDTISIDEQIKGEEDLKIEDTIADENNLSPENEAERTNALEKIYDSLSCLDENEKEVISLRFGFNDDNDFTLEQIGKVMGISKERVRQIENKALVKLKKRLKGLI